MKKNDIIKEIKNLIDSKYIATITLFVFCILLVPLIEYKEVNNYFYNYVYNLKHMLVNAVYFLLNVYIIVNYIIKNSIFQFLIHRFGERKLLIKRQIEKTIIYVLVLNLLLNIVNLITIYMLPTSFIIMDYEFYKINILIYILILFIKNMTMDIINGIFICELFEIKNKIIQIIGTICIMTFTIIIKSYIYKTLLLEALVTILYIIIIMIINKKIFNYIVRKREN